MKSPILQGVLGGLAAISPLAIPLLASAALAPGRETMLPRAVALVGGLAAVTLTGNVAMALRRPAHFRMRRQGPVAEKARRQPLIDAVGLVVYLGYLAAWFVFVPIDVGGLHLLPPPPAWLADVGLALSIGGAGFAQVAVWQNAFATPTIHEQAGQQVVDSGVYALVRHPLYAGNLWLFAGAALWLGSLAALIGVSVMVAFTLARIVIEERFLRARLPAYADYARRVRARLVPYVI